jgi:signal transduction histidine kinase
MPKDPRGDPTISMRALDALRPSTQPAPHGPIGRLVCVVGREQGRSYPLGTKAIVIGRGSDANIVLSGDDISRHHASISFERGRFVLDDLGSSNGTLVNGMPVTHHLLSFGDRIQLGQSATLVVARHDELEQRAQEIQKLEVLGRLAGALAHDFRNILNIINVTAGTLRQHALAPEVERGLDDIQQAVSAANAITGRLLCFTRGDVPVAASPVTLEPLVTEVTRLVQRTFGAEIVIDVDVPAGLAVRGDAAGLHQVLTNLCINARDAMPDGGRLTIRVAVVVLNRHEALIAGLPSEGEFVELTVADTGTGMDEATRARVFEPFFSTKGGKGTGLGLFSVFGIVRALNGAIAVESAPGHGAVFRIHLLRA